MTVSYVPDGFHTLTPYFLVEDADKFVAFITEAFDAFTIDDHREDGILVHGAYRIFGSMLEASEGRGRFPAMPMTMHLYVPDCNAVYKKAVDAGGTSIHEVKEMDYGERSGAVEDPCGNRWFIATQIRQMYPDS